MSVQLFAIELDNGKFESGEISVAGEQDEYTFTAIAGDTVFLRVAGTETTEFITSDLRPRITVIDPDDTIVETSLGELVAGIDELALVKSGSYRVIIN